MLIGFVASIRHINAEQLLLKPDPASNPLADRILLSDQLFCDGYATQAPSAQQNDPNTQNKALLSMMPTNDSGKPNFLYF